MIVWDQFYSVIQRILLVCFVCFFLYLVIYKINLHVFVYKKKVAYVRELRYKFALTLSFRDVITSAC